MAAPAGTNTDMPDLPPDAQASTPPVWGSFSGMPVSPLSAQGSTPPGLGLLFWYARFPT
jgi:hypothetical protein